MDELYNANELILYFDIKSSDDFDVIKDSEFFFFYLNKFRWLELNI